MMATGTGIAPIKAILESLLDNEDCPPVTLYWGMRTEADLYLRDEIESWAGRLYEFNFVPVLSRAGADWQGRRGPVGTCVLSVRRAGDDSPGQKPVGRTRRQSGSPVRGQLYVSARAGGRLTAAARPDTLKQG